MRQCTTRCEVDMICVNGPRVDRRGTDFGVDDMVVGEQVVACDETGDRSRGRLRNKHATELIWSS